MVIFLEDLALCMENLHAMGPFHYWQRPCSVSSPLNSSSGCVESGGVAFCNWQRSHSVSSPLDSSSCRVKSSKVVCLAASKPQAGYWGSVLKAPGAYAPASLPN